MKARRHIVPGYLDRWHHESHASWPTIASFIREAYEHTRDEPDQQIQWSQHTDSYERSRRDAQSLRAYIESPNGLPVDLDEAAIMAMPDEYRWACVDELGERLSHPVGQRCAQGAGTPLGSITHEIDQLIERLNPALEQAQNHLAEAPQLLAASLALQGRLVALQQQLHQHLHGSQVISLSAY